MESDDAPSSTFNYKCTLCNYSTDHSANVELHEKAHNQEEDTDFQCTLCNYSSNLKFVVIRHMNRDHQCPENQQHYLQVKRCDTNLKLKIFETHFSCCIGYKREGHSCSKV